MSHSSAPVIQLRSIARTLRKFALLWLVPAVAMGAAAYTYGRLATPLWEATQAPLLRDEGTDNVKRHGRFDNMEAMKTAQKTILELVRNKDALAAALTELGPPTGHSQPKTWPTTKDIERCRKHIALKPPKGAEFGSTEVVYLSVQEQTAERSLQLADAVYKQLDQRMQQLRSENATTTIVELEETVVLAKQELESSTKELQEMESSVGTDLADLRNLNESANGDNNLQSSLQEVENELRQINARHKADYHLQMELQSAKRDTERLVAMPNSLLNSQPALRRLKDGLVDAQLRTAQLQGNMRKDHPAVQAALEAEHEVRNHLHEELDVAIRGLATDLEVSGDRIRSLGLQKLEYETKLDRLARLRARYNNLISEVQQRSDILEKAQTDLSEGRSTLAAAKTGSLIKRLEKPRVGEEPQGPGLLVLTLSGLAAGLVTGLGLVFLIAPSENPDSSRWTDRLWNRRRPERRQAERQDGSGRRADDDPRSAQRHTVEQRQQQQIPERRGAPAAPPSRRSENVPASEQQRPVTTEAPTPKPAVASRDRRPTDQPTPPTHPTPAASALPQQPATLVEPTNRRTANQRTEQAPPPLSDIPPQRVGLTPEYRALPKRQEPATPPPTPTEDVSAPQPTAPQTPASQQDQPQPVPQPQSAQVPTHAPQQQTAPQTPYPPAPQQPPYPPAHPPYHPAPQQPALPQQAAPPTTYPLTPQQPPYPTTRPAYYPAPQQPAPHPAPPQAAPQPQSPHVPQHAPQQHTLPQPAAATTPQQTPYPPAPPQQPVPQQPAPPQATTPHPAPQQAAPQTDYGYYQQHVSYAQPGQVLETDNVETGYAEAGYPEAGYPEAGQPVPPPPPPTAERRTPAAPQLPDLAPADIHRLGGGQLRQS